jgi:peptide/nickel transport system substrate-binding protein
VGLFHHGTPLANDAGIEVLSTPRDYDRVKRELALAGYNGERIVVLGTSGNIPALSQVGADTLRKAGLNIDLQLTDFATMARWVLKRDAPDIGGWNVYFIIAEGTFNLTLATNSYIRGDGASGSPGWPTGPGFEALRQAWLDADDLGEQRRIGMEAQRQLWEDVPYIPMGQWLRVTAHRRSIVNVPHGFTAFYGVQKV